MNPFSPGDRVQCKAKNRRNGSVVHIYCSVCDSCKERKYAQCTGEQADKKHVLASFPDPQGCVNKRYRYECAELELEPPPPPLPLKAEEKVYDLSPLDIRPLGTATIDVPLIAPEDDDSGIELEEETSKPIYNKAGNVKAARGMFFDQYVGTGPRMERPI